MTIPRSLASVLFVGLIPFFIGCSSESKKPNGSANPWQGQTYLLNMPASHWTIPNRDVGNEFGAFVPSFLMNVKSASASAVDVLFSTSDTEGVQDMCNPTTSIEGTSAYPDFQIGPVDASVRVVEETHHKFVNITAYGLTIKNVLPTSDAVASEGEVTATVDFREVYSLIYVMTDPTPQKICDFLPTYKTACTPCPQDQANFCLTLGAVALGAQPVTDTNVEPVGESGLAASCEADGGT